MSYQYHNGKYDLIKDKELYFVFGANTRGIHGKGAALYARMYKGAKLYQGYGQQGESFAIPTKDSYIETLPLTEIKKYVNMFIS